MADSFADVNTYEWAPTAAYQSLQTMIQNEVSQGLWANEDHIDGWCFILVSSPQGVNSSWVTYTYQLRSDNTQKATVIWPAGWPAPAENINGQLPSHFFSNQTTGSGTTMQSGAVGVSVEEVLYMTYASPTSPPTYKIAGECM